MADGLRWFKYVYDVDGNVLTRELAVAPQDDNGLTFFVRAKDFESADRKADNRYMLAKTKARHAQYDREGKCRCGRARDVLGDNGKPRKRCSLCLESNAEYKERSKRRAQGEELPHRARLEVMEERRSADRAALRLEVLAEVDAKWTELGTLMCRRWLLKTLGKLGKGKAA